MELRLHDSSDFYSIWSLPSCVGIASSFLFLHWKERRTYHNYIAQMFRLRRVVCHGILYPYILLNYMYLTGVGLVIVVCPTILLSFLMVSFVHSGLLIYTTLYIQQCDVQYLRCSTYNIVILFQWFHLSIQASLYIQPYIYNNVMFSICDAAPLQSL